MLRYLLIIEDNAAFALTLKTILYEELDPTPIVWHEQTLADALPIVQQEAIDLAIVDLTLPDAHDLTAVSLLRQHAPLLPILVMTGSEDPVLRQRVRRMTAVGWLQKTTHLSRDDVITQCRLTVHAGLKLREAQTLTEEPREQPDSLLTAARSESARWEKMAIFVIIALYGLTTGVASWAHLDLKKKQDDDVAKLERRFERVELTLQAVGAEQARRQPLIGRIEGLQQQLSLVEGRLQQLQERVDSQRARLERLEQRVFDRKSHVLDDPAPPFP